MDPVTRQAAEWGHEFPSQSMVGRKMNFPAPITMRADWHLRAAELSEKEFEGRNDINSVPESRGWVNATADALKVDAESLRLLEELREFCAEHTPGLSEHIAELKARLGITS